jgi:predicted RNA-binding protein YlxR (DUF448 family)
VRKPQPIRTCVGCGERAAQRELLRMVAGAEGLALDPPGRRAAGRGAYLHRQATCWAAFARRRGPVRSLRRTPTVDERARLVAALSALSVPEVQR